jgi:hypothetical protein
MSSHRLLTSFVSASLAVLATAPGVAFADEPAPAPTAGPIAMPVAPAVTAVRPLTMHDVTPTTSIGVRTSASVVTGDESEEFFVGELVLDGEVALGPNAKLFGNVPFVMGRAFEGDNEGAPEGIGNLTLGALYTNRSGNLTGAIGGAISFAGSDEGFVGLNARVDIPSYWTVGNVYQGFVSMRSDTDRGFFEGQASYYYASGFDFEFTDEHISFGQVQLGAGAPISPQVAFIGEIGITRAFEEGAELIFTADAGLRGKLGDKGQSWMAKAGLLHIDEVNAFGASLELRSDVL